MHRTIVNPPLEVEELLERMFPDYLGYEARFLTEHAYVLIVLTLDYQYREILAAQAYDGHWTLSPRDEIICGMEPRLFEGTGNGRTGR